MTLKSGKEKLFKNISKLVITFSTFAAVQACTFFLHEEELPEILRNENPFNKMK
jgi:cyclic lactone autoinducer peptide